MSKLKISPDELIRHGSLEHKFKDLVDLLLKSYPNVK